MTNEMRRAYINRIYWRYQKSSRREKILILDEFCKVFEFTRKHAIKVLNDPSTPTGKRPGPKRKYGAEVVHHLVKLWKEMSRICSKNMVAALPLWLPFYDCPEATKELLNEISPSTVDRLLKPYREQAKVRGLSSTEPSLIKNKIPIKLLDGDVKELGYFEADTVAHCGNSLAGEFINSVTMTDLMSSWTENRATWTKESKRVRQAIGDIERSLPFKIKGFASDNGNEFFNHELHDYFNNRKEKVEMVRRRAYKKNDNAHVEQKNWTHVRELFGYERFDHDSMVDVMNDIYKNYWNPLRNFFTPSLKLKEKTREGGKITKKYDPPKTPYQRLIDSGQLTDSDQAVLKARFERLNPFGLKNDLELRLKWFFKLVDLEKAKRLQVG
jgi:hypothetical protein